MQILCRYADWVFLGSSPGFISVHNHSERFWYDWCKDHILIIAAVVELARPSTWNFPPNKYKDRHEVTGGQHLEDQSSLLWFSRAITPYALSTSLLPPIRSWAAFTKRKRNRCSASINSRCPPKYLGRTASLSNSFVWCWGISWPNSWWPTQPHLSQLTNLISKADILTLRWFPLGYHALHHLWQVFRIMGP